MRLIGECLSEKEAFGLQLYLKKEGISALYEPTLKSTYQLWIIEENDLDKATEIFKDFEAHKEDPKFTSLNTLPPPPPPPLQMNQPSSKAPLSWQTDLRRQAQLKVSLSGLIVILCFALFFLSSPKESERIDLPLPAATFSTLETQLLFDFPQADEELRAFLKEKQIKTETDLQHLSSADLSSLKALEQLPAWKGIYPALTGLAHTPWDKLPEGTLFYKIRHEEVWRLLSPIFLHASFLHVLFNMMAFAVLGKEIEVRIGRGKLLLLIFFVGILTNIAQYLVSGPYFLGFSGVICALAGFIWVRQKKAPWEGYPVPKKSLIYLAVLVFAFFGIEAIGTLLRMTHIANFDLSIANTAHLTGGALGLVLGNLPFFARKL